MHFFFDFFLKCVPIIAKMRYLCGGFPETMARPDGGMVDTRDLKSLGLCGCAGSSPAWGTKRRASSFLPSVFVFPSVPLTLLLTLRFASTHPSLATVSRGFASAIHNSVIHTQPFAPLLSTIHLPLPPRFPSIHPPFLLPSCSLFAAF